MKWISTKTKGTDASVQFVYFTDSLELPEDTVFDGISDDSSEEYEALSLLSISREIAEGPIICTVTADSSYVLWVNGQFISTGKFTDPFAGTVCDTLAITDALHPGRNQILFLVSATKKDTANLAFEIRAGETILLESSEATRYAIGSQYRPGPMLFDYDACELTALDWMQAIESEEITRVQSRNLSNMMILPRRETTISAQGLYLNADNDTSASPAKRMAQAFMAVQPLGALTEDNIHFTAPISMSTDGMYLILDLGAEETGYFDLEVEVPARAEIQIAFGEHLDDLRVRTEESSQELTALYRCRGNRTEHFTYYRTPVTCRYIQLFISANTFALHYAGLLPCRYPFEPIGTFSCSDTIHNLIYQTSLRTVELCMREDIPSLLAGASILDLRNQMLCNFYTFGAHPYARTWLRLLAKRQREDGLLENRPSGSAEKLLPEHSLIWVCALYEYVLYSGDLEFAAEVFPVLEKMLRTFWMSARGQDVLSTWKGVEYHTMFPEGEENGMWGQDAPLTLFYILALQGATRIAKWLNKNHAPEDETDYREASSWYGMLCDTAKDAFHKTFWTEDAGVYADYIKNGQPIHFSELTQSLALYADVVPAAFQDQVIQVLSGKISLDIIMESVTAEQLLFKYEALLTSSEGAVVVLNDLQARFGGMLLKGATSFWETPDGSTGCRCYGSSAIPIVIYGKYVLGAAPSEPGFADFAFRPISGGLQGSGIIPRAVGNPLKIVVSLDGFEVR